VRALSRGEESMFTRKKKKKGPAGSKREEGIKKDKLAKGEKIIILRSLTTSGGRK